MVEKTRNERVQETVGAAERGELDSASELLDGLLRDFPEDEEVLDLAGFVRFFQGRFREGEAICRKAIELNPKHAYAHKGLGLHLARQGRVQEGIGALEDAIQLDPTFFDPYWDLAIILHENGMNDRVLELLGIAKAAFPNRAAEIEQFERSVGTAAGS